MPETKNTDPDYTLPEGFARTSKRSDGSVVLC